MSDNEKRTNVIELRLRGGKPGARGRAGRAYPGLADRKTEDALHRIRQNAASIDRTQYAKPEEEVKLTDPAEEDFCVLATSGLSLAEAWRRAFDDPTNPRSDYLASSLTRQPRIMLRINELLDMRRSNLVNDAERIRQLIATRLEIEATTAAEGSTRLKALELLGKQPHVAAFEDRARVVNEKSTPEEIRDALTKKLAALGNPSRT